MLEFMNSKPPYETNTVLKMKYLVCWKFVLITNIFLFIDRLYTDKLCIN